MAQRLLVLQTILTVLLVVHSKVSSGTCPQFSLSYPPNGAYSCPGSNITFTCVLSSSALLVVITDWTGTAFQCDINQIALTQKSGGTPIPTASGTCGTLSAVTTSINGTCYTSVLTTLAVQALNGATVMCVDGDTGAVVGNATLKIATSPGPVVNLTVTNTSVDQLTVAWAPPTTGGVPTSYSASINGSSNTLVPIPANGPLQNTFTGLTSHTLYTVSVVAINCAGTSNVTSANRRTYRDPGPSPHYGPAPNNSTQPTSSPRSENREAEPTFTGSALTGIVTAVVFGGVVVVALVCVGIYCCWKRRKQSQAAPSPPTPAPAPSSPAPSSPATPAPAPSASSPGPTPSEPPSVEGRLAQSGMAMSYRLQLMPSTQATREGQAPQGQTVKADINIQPFGESKELKVLPQDEFFDEEKESGDSKFCGTPVQAGGASSQ